MGKYNDGKPDQEIMVEELQEKIAKSKLPLNRKAYIVLIYWLGCRRSEPLVIKKEDIEEKDGYLFVSINYRCPLKDLKKKDPNRCFKSCDRCQENVKRIAFSRGKHGQAGGPIKLSLSGYGLDLVKETWGQTKKGKKVFPFSVETGYRAFKSLWPHRTPHWLRYARVTKLRKRIGKDMTVDAIKSYTGIRRDTTIQGYGLKTRADLDKIADILE